MRVSGGTRPPRPAGWRPGGAGGRRGLRAADPSPRGRGMLSADPYVVLGVPRGVSSFELKRAYHNLSRKYHPDKDRTVQTHTDSFCA